ncbi:MAG: DHHA1 domain-containing protein [Roseiflexaceae bacterium]
MATERLYYVDSYLRRFRALVVGREQLRIALDQSAFYPESGGQPADRGTLNGVQVLDVQVDQDGVVWHTLAEVIDADEVQGEIDWARRFDHMQQHHGQHLLSAAFEELYGLKTVSFHLGVSVVTIDLDTASLSSEQSEAVEALVNRVIWESRPVIARFVSDTELSEISLRKAPSVQGPIRVVSVPEFDHSACGGTHPSSTGGVGVLHIRRWERRGEQIRVEFACGERVLRDLRWKHRLVGRLASSLSIASEELEESIARLRQQEDQTRRDLAVARMQLIEIRARELVAVAEPIGSYRCVVYLHNQGSMEEARTMAKLISEAGCLAVVGLAAEKGHLIIARAAGMTIDCGVVVRQALAVVGGKGGGRPELAQGGCADPAHLSDVLDAARRVIAAA